MPSCLFCARDGIPCVPLFPLDARALVAHVNKVGMPCHEGSTPETHAAMLGQDYPHAELLDTDEMWSLDDDSIAAPAASPDPPATSVTANSAPEMGRNEAEDAAPVAIGSSPRRKRARIR